jgi:hypothetical protein
MFTKAENSMVYLIVLLLKDVCTVKNMKKQAKNSFPIKCHTTSCPDKGQSAKARP